MRKSSQGTTPCFILSLPDDCGIDLTAVGEVYVTFEQQRTKLTKTGAELADIQATKVYVELTQEESILFNQGVIDVQLNWTYSSGRRGASKIKKIQMKRNTERRVLA